MFLGVRGVCAWKIYLGALVSIPPQSTLSYPIAFPSGLQGVHVDAVL